jgi:hypothetical protein
VGSIAETYLNFEFTTRPAVVDFKTNTFDHTNIDEIREILLSLNSNKAMGDDDIPVSFLKKNSDVMCELLSGFINEAFDSGAFPDSLKFARVSPLFKSDDPHDVENYRPISLLPAKSKVFELVIKARLVNHLETNNIIHKNQYGFLKKNNTTAAASCLVNDIVSGLNNKLKTSCVFIDVKKAFDCLNFDILKDKLFKIGIEGKAHKILSHYLLLTKDKPLQFN